MILKLPDSFFILIKATMKWKLEVTKNKGPSPRAYFGIFKHDHYLGVFGGSV